MPRRKRVAVAGVTHEATCPQDLSRVPGIGPALEQKLYRGGIGSYWEVANLSDQDLRSVLELKPFQAVNLAAMKEGAARLAEETNAVGRGWDGSEPDDFDVLEGLGEMYERRLYEAGICTYRALAGTSIERLIEICKAPAWNQPDYARWIERARALLEARDTA